ncbi:MAG: hypothetical protein KDA62_22590, partial [Planctomycetales bacterium]|nr:hypothetical protein [Planctomycetales bacterium]
MLDFTSAALTLVIMACGSAPGHAELLAGIDVSHWQGTINWNDVANSGIEFAFIKASEGTDFVDARFQYNISNSLTAGILSGAYHFARPDIDLADPLDAVREATHFADTIRPYYESGTHLRP